MFPSHECKEDDFLKKGKEIAIGHIVDCCYVGDKCCVGSSELLRSSVGIKKGLMMANSVGVIDADYADNAVNDGHIHVALYNTLSTPINIPKGE